MDRHAIARHVGDQQLLAESLGLLTPVASDVVASFYDQLFADHPQVRPMFPSAMEGQRDKLLKAIIALVTHYDRPEQLVPALTAMGRRHEEYGVRIDHYSASGSPCWPRCAATRERPGRPSTRAPGCALIRSLPA